MKVKHPLLTARVDRLIGPVLATALAVSTAFALLAMPADLMGWLLVAPPVDIPTRILVTLVGALLMGGAAYALFAWIDQPPRPIAEDSDEWDFDTEVAKPMTRGNAPPKPILARAELGAAMPPIAAAPTIAIVPTKAPEPIDLASVADAASADATAAREIEAEDAEFEDFVFEDDALLLEMPLSRVVEDALAAPAADAPPIETASLDELMRRLQAGIDVNRAAPVAANASDQDALRDALHELQRMAAATR